MKAQKVKKVLGLGDERIAVKQARESASLKPIEHRIDTESFRCSCKAPMCLNCGDCSSQCACASKL